MPEPTLLDVEGIGPGTASKLKDQGITDPSQLAVMRPEELKNLLNCSRKKAAGMINSAKNIAPPILLSTAKEVLEYRNKNVQYISTGSSKLDRLLQGGIPTGVITGLAGQFSSGKTQICHQAIVNCLSDLKRKAVWVQTESRTFSPKRLLEIAEAQGKEINLDDVVVIGEFIKKRDKHGDIIEAPLIDTPVALMRALKRVGFYIEHEGNDVGLVVIDSYSAPFRNFLSGREMLPDRSRETGRQFGYFNELVAKHNIALLLTCQVMSNPVLHGEEIARKKFAIPYMVWGGHLLKHSVTYWLGLYQVSSTDNMWSATTFDCPLPRGTANFKIDSSGIRD